MGTPSLAGRLLVSSPLIGDGTFRRTVVRLLAHEEEGALGIILNRPTDTPAVGLVEPWGERISAPAVVFDGGPVAGDSVVGVAEAGPVDLHRDPDDLVDAPGEIRLFAGQSSWGGGQLEDEVGEQAWWVVDMEPGDTLTRDPGSLWERVLRRQPRPTAWFANFPDDLRTG